MEEYPEELRTPPLPLVSLVGCPELHTLISTHLHSEQPLVNTLALPDFSKISIMAKSPKDASTSVQPAGILKRDWLLKHRTRIPALVAALFSSDHISGDPAQWLQVCTDLDNLKAVTQGRNIKLAVVVVQSATKDDISEDRMIAFRKRAEIDSKYLIVFVPNDALEQKQSLNRLGSTFAELANIYYRDEGRRIKTRLERKSVSSIELNIRYCFKVAVYAEFRRDWVEALRFYEDAYQVLREMIQTSTKWPAIQRLVEIRTVAEQLHFKISTLLLHGGKVVDAITWFRQHNASYRKLVGAPEVIFLHWEWLSRQFLVFAELLETCSAITQSISSPVPVVIDKLTEWEFCSAYYYQLAAHYLKEKRSYLELALSMSETAGDIDGLIESVIPSVYMGQFARLIEPGKLFTMQPLTDEEYVRYSLAKGKKFQHSFEIIPLLKRSFEAYSNAKAQRMASYCRFQMAKEYFAANDFGNAKQLFDGVTSLYRQEGWITLLWEVLGYLRECSRRLGSVKDFVEFSLEMAALPVSSVAGAQPSRFKECCPSGPASFAQKEVIHKEVFGLIRGESGLASQEDKNNLQVTSDHPLHLEIDLVSPLRVVLLASVAFHEHMIKPGVTTTLTLSLLSQLPHLVEIDNLEVQFNQSKCNFIVVNGQRSQVAAISNGQRALRVETAVLKLVTSKWLRLTYDVKSEQSGKLECISVIARMGPHFTICCRAESPASMNDLPLWKFEETVETYPTKDLGLALSGQKATQIEEPDPLVDLKLGAFGPALVGESFMIPVTVTSMGHVIHCGELKINLVDTKGGGLLSPREAEPFATDNLHVELLGISDLECGNESQIQTDNIRNIQASFGLVSVPFLNVGDSWSCNLEIKWHRPKPVMLYMSLSYSADSSEPNAQKIHVHRSLLIEGKTAVLIRHQFMLPFGRDPLLLPKVKLDSDQMPSLPLNETSILIVAARNCTEVPLQLLSMYIEAEDEASGRSCSVQHQGADLVDPALLVPGEEFKKVFSVIPDVNFSKLRMGTLCLRWRRDYGPGQLHDPVAASEVLTRHELPDVNVELSPLVLALECPPHAILGSAFTYSVRIQNQTLLLQEIKYSLVDSQNFVLSGCHSDTIFVMPISEHVLNYKLVPLASGSQQLPGITVTSIRYSISFQPSIAESTIFVFPSNPHFKTTDLRSKTETMAVEF